MISQKTLPKVTINDIIFRLVKLTHHLQQFLKVSFRSFIGFHKLNHKKSMTTELKGEDIHTLCLVILTKLIYCCDVKLNTNLGNPCSRIIGPVSPQFSLAEVVQRNG